MTPRNIYTIGTKGVGKTTFCHSLLSKYELKEINDEKSPVKIWKANDICDYDSLLPRGMYFHLHEIPAENANQLMSAATIAPNPNMVIFLLDASISHAEQYQHFKNIMDALLSYDSQSRKEPICFLMMLMCKTKPVEIKPMEIKQIIRIDDFDFTKSTAPKIIGETIFQPTANYPHSLDASQLQYMLNRLTQQQLAALEQPKAAEQEAKNPLPLESKRGNALATTTTTALVTKGLPKDDIGKEKTAEPLPEGLGLESPATPKPKLARNPSLLARMRAHLTLTPPKTYTNLEYRNLVEKKFDDCITLLMRQGYHAKDFCNAIISVKLETLIELSGSDHSSSDRKRAMRIAESTYNYVLDVKNNPKNFREAGTTFQNEARYYTRNFRILAVACAALLVAGAVFAATFFPLAPAIAAGKISTLAGESIYIGGPTLFGCAAIAATDWFTQNDRDTNIKKAAAEGNKFASQLIYNQRYFRR